MTNLDSFKALLVSKLKERGRYEHSLHCEGVRALEIIYGRDGTKS